MGTKKAMTEEIAVKEIAKWLDYKRIKQKTREENQSQIDTLVDSMIDGSLVLNEDFSLTQTLSFELESQKTFTYKPRLTVSEINLKLKGVDATKAFEMLVAYVSASTGMATGVVKQLDAVDYKLAQAINMFFL